MLNLLILNRASFRWPPLLTADDPFDALDIRVGVEEDALRELSISASSSRLLVVTLHWFGKTGVDDVAHVRLVNAHAERDGGADDLKSNESSHAVLLFKWHKRVFLHII